MAKRTVCLIAAAVIWAVVTRGSGVAKIIWKGPEAMNYIALTFDDGPKPEFSEKLLGVLSKYGVHATFFVIGSQAEQWPDILKRMADEGHEIGNHTYSHVNIGNSSAAVIRRELVRTNKVITMVTGERPKLFRPPGGEYNSAARSE